MGRAACTCYAPWFRRHEEGCPRRNDLSAQEHVKSALFARHDFAMGEWVAWPEVFRIDVFAMRFWSSGVGRIRVAYEVKVSRADLLAELRKPEKRAHALEVSNQFLFATPKGLLRPGELPPECGLVEVDEAGRSRVKVKAPMREARPFNEDEVASLLRMDLFRSGADDLLRKVRALENIIEWKDTHAQRTRAELGEAREKLALYEGAILGT